VRKFAELRGHRVASSAGGLGWVGEVEREAMFRQGRELLAQRGCGIEGELHANLGGGVETAADSPG